MLITPIGLVMCKLGGGGILNKIGEQQVQSIFSKQLEHKIRANFGETFPFASGEFNGMQDKKYADYFAGVNASNILIEFKEFFREIKDEKKKPLRLKLCQELPDNLIETSCLSHHISWREDSNESITTYLQRYISAVCPLFNIKYAEFEITEVGDFIDGFLNKGLGSDNESFSRYVNFLGGISGDETASFFGVLISFDKEVGMKNTIFKSMSDLIGLTSKLEASEFQDLNNSESKMGFGR